MKANGPAIAGLFIWGWFDPCFGSLLPCSEDNNWIQTMNKIAAVTICLLGILTQPAVAVDGYKGLRFGASEKELMAHGLCTMYPGDGLVAGTSLYQCSDFNMGGNTTNAYAYFIDGQFLRLAVSLDWGSIGAISRGLASKYGPATSGSTQAQIAAIESTPNSSAYVAYDKDTVYINMESDANLNKHALLIYSDPSFNARLDSKRNEAFQGDL
ncbi:MAG: hypothetical protein ACRCT2_02995 [Plesiomonas shigelloides]